MIQGAATGLPTTTSGWMNVPAVSSLIEGYINRISGGFRQRRRCRQGDGKVSTYSG